MEFPIYLPEDLLHDLEEQAADNDTREEEELF